MRLTRFGNMYRLPLQPGMDTPVGPVSNRFLIAKPPGRHVTPQEHHPFEPKSPGPTAVPVYSEAPECEESDTKADANQLGI